ncbi:fas apoptotic inhibitory molecule 1-like isoform X3 [Cervus elaphus]|uniref:fas apoptotic inhibitory molecule 1-like isoform X3 n=1 Tax=Cervus elaphus TaxID=9860 RepID=UPI001CC2860A|nr:fas apoptotic inhibitory molecule 1-like isoform X3 [Cervus elaphus]
MTDLVAVWKVALSDRVHKIEFEHGTASGKRVVYVNGKKVLRKEWMFSLIGKETFCIGASKIKATINIKPRCASSYDYTLEINGKSLKEYMESRKKTTNTWILHLNSKDFRVVLEKDTMDVWCNGKKMKTVMDSLPLSHQGTPKIFIYAIVAMMIQLSTTFWRNKSSKTDSPWDPACYN